MTQELSTLLIENSLYQDEAAKQELITKQPQKVKDAFWINTLGLFAIQKDHGDRLASRKYFADISKTRIKDIPVDVNDMAAATKMAYDAGFLNDSFTYEFTKFLFIFKSKPTMTIDQEKLRALFKKVNYSKIIPSPKLRTITDKYLKGEANIDHVLFPYFYFARQQKYCEDFQLYCRMFYKTITKDAIKVSQAERSGQNIDKHLSGPDIVSSKVVAVQSASTQSIVVSPTINPPVVTKASPIPAKKIWTWDNFNFYDEFANSSNKSDYVVFFFSALSYPVNAGILLANQSKNDKNNIAKFFSHVLSNYTDIYDVIKTPVSVHADFFSVISNWKLGVVPVSDKQALDLTSDFMRHADKAGYPITFWGLEDKDGNLNQRIQNAFWKSGYGPSNFVSYSGVTPETKERGMIAEYLRLTSSGHLISTPSYLIPYVKKYQKQGDYSYNDKVTTALLWLLNNKAALDYALNIDKGTGDKYVTIILDGYNSNVSTTKSSAEKVIEEILNDPTYYNLFKTKISQDVFDAVKKKMVAIDYGEKIYSRIKDSNYSKINLSSSEMSYVYYNSLEKYKDDYKFVATITAYIMRDAKSPYFKANKDWILEYLVFNSSSGEFFTFLVDRYDSFDYFSKNVFFTELVHTALLRQGMLQIWGQMNMDRLGAGQNITPFPGTTGKGFGGWTQFILGKLNETNLTINAKAFRERKKNDDIRVGEIKKATDVGLVDSSTNSMYRDMFRKMLLSDPTKDVLGDFKAFLMLEAIFNGSSSYSPEFKGSGSSVSIFASVFKDKYSIAEISDLYSMNMEYGAYGGGGYGSAPTGGSIVGNITQDSQSFVNFITTNSEEFMRSIDKIKIEPGQKRRILSVAVNAGSDVTQEAFNKFVSFMQDNLNEDLFDAAIARSSYDRAYFKLVAGGFMKPRDMNYRTYELQQFAGYCKDKDGKITNPEELIRIYSLKNTSGPGGIGDAYYRIENLLDSLSIREIADGIMTNEKKTEAEREVLLEKLFSSVNMGRKGNDRKNAIATKVISDQCIKESLLETNKKSAIPILVPLTGENLLEIFKFNNFEVELPDNLKIGKKNTITQAYKKAKTWTPNIPDLLVSRVEDTQANLDMKAVEYSKYYNDQHGDQGIVFLESFDVNLEQFPELKEFMKENPTPTIIPAFHGTGSVAASMILRFGFKVVKKSMGGVQVVGKMLGDGIYFSNIVSKSIQYLGDNGYGRKMGTIGYLFEMDAYIGKKGVHHNSAGLNNDGIKSPEWCVFDGRAQLVIKKAHKVKMVHGQVIRDLKKQYPQAINEDRFFPNFAKFLKEERGNSTASKSTTFIFYSGLIPDASENLIEFDDWLAQNKSSKISYTPGQYGPEITIEGVASDAPFYHIPNSAEFVYSDPEGLYTLFKKLTK